MNKQNVKINLAPPRHQAPSGHKERLRVKQLPTDDLHEGTYRPELPEATPDEFDRIKKSIAQFGVMEPIIVDEHGVIIGGRLRRRACAELGLKTCPAFVVGNLTEQQKRQLAVALNVCRKFVRLSGKRATAKYLLESTPFLSDRSIAGMTGLDHTTVGRLRKKLEAGGAMQHLTTRQGKDGKTYRLPKIYVETPNQMDRATAALTTLGSNAPNHTIRLRRAEGLARKLEYAKEDARLVELQDPADLIQIVHGDFRNLEIADASCGLLLTDPPYDKVSLPLWPDLAKFAPRVLRPGGILAAYSGTMFLPTIVQAFEGHLTYVWKATFKRTPTSWKRTSLPRRPGAASSPPSNHSSALPTRSATCNSTWADRCESPVFGTRWRNAFSPRSRSPG